jgi:AcrR family transcriptional regulator
MGIIERKERDKIEMRDKIVKAAVEVFSEEGYEKTSIRTIADRIEYSPATIYLYFKDKAELLQAVHEVGFGLLLEEMQKVQAIQNPLERLREISYTYIRFSMEHPQQYNLMFILMEPMEDMEREEPWQKGENAFAFLQSVVEECMQCGLIPNKNAKEMAFFCWAFMHGLVSLHNRCRMRVLHLSEQENRDLVFKAVEEWITLHSH